MSAIENARKDVAAAEEQAERLELIAAVLAAQQAQQPVPVPVRPRPVVHVSGGAIAAGTGAVLIIGTVLVSMLLAVAITAASVAVCAVVLRKMLDDARRNRP